MTERETLESRVAVVETGLQTLTREVGQLVDAIRAQSTDVAKQIAALSIAVEKAAAPRATNWQTLFAAIALVVTIGGGVWVVLDGKISRNTLDLVDSERRSRVIDEDLRAHIDKFHDELVAHQQLKSHPVGEARIDAMEKQMLLMTDRLSASLAALDAKLQKEYQLAGENTATRVADLDMRLQKEFSLTDARANARLEKLERWNYDEKQADEAELRGWRLGAMAREKQKLGKLKAEIKP